MPEAELSPTRPPAAGDILAVAFGTAAVQWAAGYLCRMPPAVIPAPVLLGALIVIQLLGGAILSIATSRGWVGAALTGVLTGLINLLVLGAVLGDEPSKAGAGAAGFILGSIVVTLIGFTLAKSARRGSSSVNWTGALAKVAVFATLIVIIAGGLVTSKEAGLAVPDWPSTEGALMFLYPLSKMTGGVYFEHAHRLYGALVGLTTVALAVHLWLIPRDGASGRARWVGTIAAILVIFQGVMGGLRVTELSPGLGILHGMNAQIVLAVVVALAAIVSTTWSRSGAAEPRESGGFDRTLSIVVLVVLLIQLGLGAAYRHLSSVDDAGPGVMHILWTHLSFAVIVLGVILFAGLRASAKYPDLRPVRKSGKGMLHVVGLQVVLGVIALIVVLTRSEEEAPGALEVWTTTAHQAVGAVLLGVAVLYAVWLRRFVRPA